MGVGAGRHEIEAWARGGLLLEVSRYAPGPAGEIPKHSHEGYQICLSLDFPGEYRYRSERHPVPVGSLSVIHPGEVHAARDPHDRGSTATYRMMYAEPALLGGVAAQVSGHEGGDPPFFRPVILDRDLAGRFLALHESLHRPTPELAWDSLLLSVLATFVSRHSEARPSSTTPVGRERRAVRLARERLEDGLAEDVPLEELSRVANLSPYHLARVFSREVGLPPHAYQARLRVDRARELLLRGWTISGAARAAGFFDQSHLNRHFKRLVGVTPGRYAKSSKNVQ